MLETQRAKTELIIADVVAKRLKLLPSRSPEPGIVPCPVPAAADQWSEERNASQSDGHASLETTEDIGQRHPVGYVGEVHLCQAD